MIVQTATPKNEFLRLNFCLWSRLHNLRNYLHPFRIWVNACQKLFVFEKSVLFVTDRRSSQFSNKFLVNFRRHFILKDRGNLKNFLSQLRRFLGNYRLYQTELQRKRSIRANILYTRCRSSLTLVNKKKMKWHRDTEHHF